MEIFISWSGSLSQKIAKELYFWLPRILQFSEPYFSPSDIEKGAKWDNEITKKLDQCFMGIICLTPENIEKPWILFEAGALSNKLDKSRVCPILFGLKNTDLKGPLSTFQTTTFNKDEFKKLIDTINKNAGSRTLKNEIVHDALELHFPLIEKKINSLINSRIIDDSSNIINKRTDRDILEEILEITRNSYNSETVKKITRFKEKFYIDLTDFIDNKNITLDIFHFNNFRDLRDEIYYILKDHVSAYCYGYDWVLINKKDNEILKSMKMINKIPKGEPYADNRSLNEVGISKGVKLKAIRINTIANIL